ncbi:hypothetical protein FB451DRAFT_1215771 [Mycena latifolia]|nr:hypothetical protein FB451DRAFT_1215771 [Mycena latifolia]
MMIPQELIDAIVFEVQHTESLKACALVSSSFCGPSQRILLCSLTLDNRNPRAVSYSAACTRLTESPHLAAYITRCYIKLDAPESRPPLSNLRELLGKLTNVRRFSLRGDPGPQGWDDLAPILIDFFERQRLLEVHLRFVQRLPPPVLASVVSSVQAVSFWSVQMDRAHNGPLPPFQHAVSSMEQLRISGPSRTVCDVLSRPECAVYMANLKKLVLRPHLVSHSAIISAANRRLEHLRFDSTFLTIHAAIPPLPPLVTLRSIDLIIHWAATTNNGSSTPSRASLHPVPQSSRTSTSRIPPMGRSRPRFHCGPEQWLRWTPCLVPSLCCRARVGYLISTATTTGSIWPRSRLPCGSVCQGPTRGAAHCGVLLAQRHRQNRMGLVMNPLRSVESHRCFLLRGLPLGWTNGVGLIIWARLSATAVISVKRAPSFRLVTLFLPLSTCSLSIERMSWQHMNAQFLVTACHCISHHLRCALLTTQGTVIRCFSIPTSFVRCFAPKLD